MRWVLILPQTIALKEFFRLCFWQEGPSVGLPVLEKWTWKSNKAKVARVCRVKCYREKTYRKISEKLQRECPLVFSWVLTSACMWKEHLRPQKEPSEMIRGNSAWDSHRNKNRSCSHQSDWEKHLIHQTLGKVLRKVLPQNNCLRRIINRRLSIGQDPI